jgi:hypothetical protein
LKDTSQIPSSSWALVSRLQRMSLFPAGHERARPGIGRSRHCRSRSAIWRLAASRSRICCKPASGGRSISACRHPQAGPKDPKSIVRNRRRAPRTSMCGAPQGWRWLGGERVVEGFFPEAPAAEGNGVMGPTQSDNMLLRPSRCGAQGAMLVNSSI